MSNFKHNENSKKAAYQERIIIDPMIGETKLSDHLHSLKLAQPKRIEKSTGHYKEGQRATSLTKVCFRKWISSTMCWVIEGLLMKLK